MVTVTLPKRAKRPLTVRHGARLHTVAPGGSAEVPERIAAVMVRQGAQLMQQDEGAEGSDAATS